MKRSILILSVLTGYFLLCSVSCEEPEAFVNIKAIEWSAFNELDAYRLANGVSDAKPFVFQNIMVKEAQLFSLTQAYSETDIDTVGISLHWDIIHDKLGGYNDASQIKRTTATSAKDMISEFTSDTALTEVLLGDYSQCGIGIQEVPNKAESIITIMLMKVD